MSSTHRCQRYCLRDGGCDGILRMPAFGKPGDDDVHAWKIAAYIRHLPQLTHAEERQVLQRSRGPMDHGDAPQSH